MECTFHRLRLASVNTFLKTAETISTNTQHYENKTGSPFFNNEGGNHTYFSDSTFDVQEKPHAVQLGGVLSQSSKLQLQSIENSEIEQLFDHTCTSVAPSEDRNTWRKDFDPIESRKVRMAKEYAVRRCNMALLNIRTGSGYPQRLASSIFNQRLDLSLIEETILNIRSSLQSANIVAATCQDPECNRLNPLPPTAYVDSTNNDLVICPRFFRMSPSVMIQTIIHEAGHLAGIDRNTPIGEEEYCAGKNCLHACTNSANTIDNVDAWANYIKCLMAY